MRNGLFAATLLLLISGCGEDPLKLRFDVDKSIPEQTIPGSIALCNLPVPVDVLGSPFDVTMTQEEDFPEQDTDVKHIESAKLKRLELTLTATSPEPTWDFLETISIFVEASGLERKLVASLGTEEEPIPDGLTTLDLDTKGVNLAPYVKANGGFTMTSEATGCAPEDNAVFGGDVVIRVIADPI